MNKQKKIILKGVKPSRKDIGRFGELAACYYLKSKGFAIRKQNVNLKVGEIDIVAEKDNTIHFIEVKSIIGNSGRVMYITPEDHLDRKKLSKLKKTALVYLALHGNSENKEISIDGLLVKIFTEGKDGKTKSSLFPKNISRLYVSYLQNIHIY